MKKNLLVTIVILGLVLFGSPGLNSMPIKKGGIKNPSTKGINSILRKKTIVNPFEGEWNWEKNSATKSFSLTITQDTSGNLVGTYCYIIQNGDKVDCPSGKQVSFKVPVPIGNAFLTIFASSYSQTTGNVTVTFNETT